MDFNDKACDASCTQLVLHSKLGIMINKMKGLIYQLFYINQQQLKEGKQQIKILIVVAPLPTNVILDFTQAKEGDTFLQYRLMPEIYLFMGFVQQDALTL